MTSESLISWRTLETLAGLDGLGDLHRSLLTFAGVADASALPLRRAQQRAEAELNRFAQNGRAQRVDGDWLLPAELVRAFYTGPLPS